MQLNQKRQISISVKLSSIQCDSAGAASDLFRAPALAFQRCGELPPGPIPDRRQTRQHLTWPHNPHDHDPMNPLTLLETFRQLAIVRGVASSIQGPHPRQLVFPPHPCPCPATAAAARGYLKPSRASRFAVRGQPPWQQHLHPVSVGATSTLSVWAPDSPSKMGRRKRRRR